MNQKQNSVNEWEQSQIQRAKSGDYAAFEQLFDSYRTPLYRQALRKLRNADDAQDCVQETALKAFRAIHSVRPDRPIGPWLRCICSNCCCDLLRERRAVCEDLDDHAHYLSDAEADVAACAEEDLEAEVVTAAIKRIPPKYAQILMWRHYEDLDVLEIARRLNRPEGTVKSWLFRARALLRHELQPLLDAA